MAVIPFYYWTEDFQRIYKNIKGQINKAKGGSRHIEIIFSSISPFCKISLSQPIKDLLCAT